MSFRRLIPKRASARKRRFPVASSSNERREELDYDGTKNCILNIENDLQQLRKKLKPVKRNCKTRYGHDLGDIERHIKQDIHQHMRSLNQHFGLKYDEVNKLERTIGNRNDEIRGLDVELKEKTRQITALNIKLKDKDKNVKALQQQFSEAEAERKTQNSKLAEQEKSFSLEITSLQKQLEQRERDIESLQNSTEEQKNTLTTELKKNQEELINLQNSTEEQKNTLTTELKKNQEELIKTQSALQGEKQHIVHSFQEDLKNKDNTINRLKEQLKQCDNYYKQQIEQIYAKNEQNIARLKSEAESRENTITHLFSELEVERAAREDERKQKDDVLTRLSAVAGDRLRNNNPGITDLSDPNRPMKIAEKFTEMYDNDWTDSMEALEDLKITEEECVEILLHFVTDSYEECGRILHGLNGHLEKAVLVREYEDETNQPNGSTSPSDDGLPAEITKPIKDLRRKLADNSVLTLQQKLPQHLQKKRGITEDQMKACKKFIEDCIRYTWMMQMQDPPVYIEWKFSHNSTIDTNILRSYTRAGNKVDFVVWPVLYLHKDGPVLNKGVVQPMPQ